MNFYEHKFFRTVSDSCFRVTFIADSKNHKSRDNISFVFPILIKLLRRFWGVAFSKFLENYNEETAWWGHRQNSILLHRRSQELRLFGGNFLEFTEQIIVSKCKQLRKTASELLNIIFLNFSIVHFSCLEPFTAHLSLVKKF